MFGRCLMLALLGAGAALALRCVVFAGVQHVQVVVWGWCFGFWRYSAVVTLFYYSIVRSSKIVSRKSLGN